jgi:excisionase family DNA binding protein
MTNDIDSRIEIKEIKQMLARIERRVCKLENQNTNEYATPDELADLLKTSPNNIYRKIRSGEIKAQKLGRSYRIPMNQFRHVKDKSNEDLKEKIFG